MTIDIASITADDFQMGKYEEVLPEYYELKKVTENDGLWHVNQNVFEHVVAGFDNLGEVLRLDFLSTEVADKISNYLENKIDILTRRELLIVSIILHDIAKSATVMETKPGCFGCPGHELVGASWVKNFSQRFGLSEEETEYVRRIVLNHGLVSSIAGLIIANGDDEKYLSLFQGVVGDVDIELCLLIMADDMATDLPKTAAEQFEKRKQVFTGLLIKMSDSL